MSNTLSEPIDRVLALSDENTIRISIDDASRSDRLVPAWYPDCLSTLSRKAPAGATFFDGYLKFYGFDDGAGLDVMIWNSEEDWKFAWPASGRDFWCFAGTAWGDQFAIDRTSPVSDRSPVYHLDAETLEPRPCAASVQDFLQQVSGGAGFLQGDDVFPAWVERQGPLDMRSGLIPVPPRCFRREVDIDRIFVTSYRSVMTMNGDLHTQTAAVPPGTVVSKLDTYTDGNGRSRLKLAFETH